MSSVELYWIPLGAGGHSVRFNGVVYEAIAATVQRRPRCDLYHSALLIDVAGGRHSVEMTPVPRGDGSMRGVVVTAPVGIRALGRLRVFRYEVRRWRDGVVPDLGAAVGAPIAVADDDATAQRVYDALAEVPPLVWGRDELRVGDMWSCNSVVSWALARAGLDRGSVALPRNGRAPGWDAGWIAAERAR